MERLLFQKSPEFITKSFNSINRNMGYPIYEEIRHAKKANNIQIVRKDALGKRDYRT